MKKLSILLLLTLMAVGAGAVTVDVTVTKKGTLLDAVMQQTSDLGSITELTVRGPLDEWDDMNVWADMTNLEVLNLQHAETDVFRNATMLTKLRRVALPDRVKRLDQMAFYGCTALSEVNIPSSLEQMGYYAFAMCQSLKEVSLPASFNRSEGYIFNGCSALKDVYCYSSDYEGSLFDDSNSGVTFHVHTILVDFFRGKENVQGLNVVGMDFNFSSLRLTSPVTIKDVSYYQGADITFDHGQYYDNSRYTSIYTMGALEIDAPASTKWQMGNISQLTFQASGRRLKAEISNFGPDDDDEEWDDEDWDYYLKRNDMPEDSNRKIFCKQMQAIILAYCHALENAGYKEIVKELGKFTAGYLTKAGVKRCGGVLNNMAKTGIGTAEQLWDAAEFGQENPLLTNTAGIYMWNVPQGLWQVRFEKEGFQPASTEWLPVPPPQLEVNIPMTRTSAPVVKEAMAFSDHVGISFDRPMLTSSLAGISVSQNGQKVEGTTEAIDESEGLALSARFTPASNFTANTVTLTIPTTVKSYAGISLTPEYSTTLEVRHAIEGLIVEDGAAIKVGDVGYVTVTAYPAVAVRGKAISVSTASSLIGIEADELLFTDDGQCLVPLKGLLPGQAVVTFAIGDIEASATVYVKYSLNEACARPVASINSGADVVPDTMVELYTATEGATIYYTTDGSCPCDELSRKRYTEPIVITEPVTIQAMAVSDGLDDSEIVTLRYGIGTYSAIETVTAATKDLDTYYTLRGMPVMPPLAKGVYIHVSRTPQGMK